MYIIGGGKIISFSNAVPYYDNGAVVVDGGTILNVGQTADIKDAYPDAEYIDAGGGLIAPGLIDMHWHSRNVVFQSGMLPRYASEDRYRMFRDCLWNIERMLDPDRASALAYSAALLAIKNGITTVFEHHSLQAQPSGSLHSIASILRECGIRACIGGDVSERFGAIKATASIRDNLDFFEYCSSLNIDTLKPVFALHSSLELSDTMLEACVKAMDGRAPTHIHIGEVPDDHLFSIRRFGKSPARRLIDVGALTRGSIVLCGPFTSINDLELVAEHGCFPVISPMIAALLSTAYSSDFEKKCNDRLLSIGTDSLSFNMLEAARSVAFQFGLSGESNSSIYSSVSKMLFEANPNAASGFFGKRLGVIEPGAAADIIILNQALPCAFASDTELTCSLISSGAVCKFTMVNGRILMRNSELTELDEKLIASRFTSTVRKLLH